MNYIEEQVTLRVIAECVICHRKLDTSHVLGGESVRTGNTTQRAAYWLEAMTSRILGAAHARHWELTKEGYRCAHCTASEFDKTDAGYSTKVPFDAAEVKS